MLPLKTYFILIVLVVSALWLSNCQSGGDKAGELSALDTIPVVQVLAPGFVAKEIPVQLNNINVLRYGSDGNLYAMGYDGYIHKLEDTDGDGLEDKATVWWDKDPLVMPVGMVLSDEGIYVSAKNKVVLLTDTDNDGKGDKEQVITTDWEQPVVFTGTTSTGVDAFGITRDKDGNIYFALGASNFTNGYLVDSLGKGHFNINSERGTILKVTPGSSKREIYCTGTRFPVAMAFNEEGDLFVTDQEGATWLPNGNPYDELLHIQKGRHYGFPPRHPRYLNNVIDEPSVYDYKPQHQSTCGLNFNLPVNGGPVFGPEWWSGDAIVSGYSRGKIYRTKLVKTAAGYVAENAIIASLPVLTVDAAVSPAGDLVVATHSGPPDWGFGPGAQGKLYKIFYVDKELPSPVKAWVPEPGQVRIAFDKPLSKQYLDKLTGNIKIEYGEFVEAADRFEVQRPGYQAVFRQMAFPREIVQVRDAFLSEDQQTLVLSTTSHTQAATYAISLPSFTQEGDGTGVIHQYPVIDLSYNLNGLEVKWQGSGQTNSLTAWVPHPDLTVSREFLGPTKENTALSNVLRQDGKVSFRTRMNLWHMLRADQQPETTLDYVLPPENVTLVFRSSQPLEVVADSAKATASVRKGDLYETSITFTNVARAPYSIEYSMNTTGGQDPVLELSYYTSEDARLRALQPHRFFQPWVDAIFLPEQSPVKENPALAGGNWARGKKLFYGEALCSTCHAIGGKGSTIGPDLSNLVFRDYNSVLRDIKDPSASINPDYVAHTVTLANGKQITGMLSYKKDSVVIRDVTDQRTAVLQSEVKSTRSVPVSLMPAGLDKMLEGQKMKDLMSYLLTTWQPAKIHTPFLPPMRKKIELETVLRKGGVEDLSGKTPDPLNILWVSGPKDHGPDEHDYDLQQERYARLLSLAENVAVDTAFNWPSDKQFENADVIVFYLNYPQFSEENGKQLDVFLEKGGGLVYLHYAVDATQHPMALANRIGLAWKGGAAKFRHGRLEMDFKNKTHPITKGFDKVVFTDESYWQLEKGNKEIDLLATGDEEGNEIPLMWTTTQGNGRAFVSIPGHYNWTFDDPLFRTLLLRGIAWTADRPVDMFNDLIPIGARISQ